MAKQIQLRRGTEAENNAFTGALAELTVDITNKSLRLHDGVTAGGVALVNNATNQTIDGIKTFTSSPIVPTPTTGNQVATKEYVDYNSVSVSDFANLKSTCGYQKLPNGLILQWGYYESSGYTRGSVVPVTLPIAFPTSALLSMCSSVDNGNNDRSTVGSVLLSNSQIQVWSFSDRGIIAVRWLAIGY
jgi:hypothetical protein